jgi:hypothetical protein
MLKCKINTAETHKRKEKKKKGTKLTYKTGTTGRHFPHCTCAKSCETWGFTVVPFHHVILHLPS